MLTIQIIKTDTTFKFAASDQPGELNSAILAQDYEARQFLPRSEDHDEAMEELAGKANEEEEAREEVGARDSAPPPVIEEKKSAVPTKEGQKPILVPGKAKAPKQSRGGTRQSAFADKRFFAKATENPRRAGTPGAKSFSIVQSKPGIDYNAYVAAGGRPQDLRFDISKGWVEAR